VPFLTELLSFIFAASDFIEGGWDAQRWNSEAHGWGSVSLAFERVRQRSGRTATRNGLEPPHGYVPARLWYRVAGSFHAQTGVELLNVIGRRAIRARLVGRALSLLYIRHRRLLHPLLPACLRLCSQAITSARSTHAARREIEPLREFPRRSSS